MLCLKLHLANPYLPTCCFVLTGTTDSPCDLTDYPMPSEDDIQFILKEIRNYLSPDVEGKSACHVRLHGMGAHIVWLDGHGPDHH